MILINYMLTLLHIYIYIYILFILLYTGIPCWGPLHQSLLQRPTIDTSTVFQSNTYNIHAYIYIYIYMHIYTYIWHTLAYEVACASV
jgi:hypothetical protein